LLLWEEVAVAAESAAVPRRLNRVKTSQLKQVIDTHVLSRFWCDEAFW
jgi:hypothetical protein